MTSYIDIDAAIKLSRALQDRKKAVTEQIDIVRSDLRNAVKLGGVTPEQRQYVEETYPLRERVRKGRGKTPVAA